MRLEGETTALGMRGGKPVRTERRADRANGVGNMNMAGHRVVGMGNDNIDADASAWCLWR